MKTTFIHGSPWPRNISWTLGQIIKSWIWPGIGTLGFVYMMAYALAEWCTQA